MGRAGGWLRAGMLAAVAAAVWPAAGAGSAIVESARRIPVAYEVDVAVVGGSTGAVAAAVEAASRGARVLLITHKPYLGEDMCATLRLMPGGASPHPLARKLFSGAGSGPVRPMHIKKTLDEALLESGVEFLYHAYFSDVLRDGSGRLAGIVMANPAGRQAVVAKVVIDATARAVVARHAGVEFRPYPRGRGSFRRIVVSEGVKASPAAGIRHLGTVSWSRRPAMLGEYTLSIDMPDGSFASFARAEQVARELTYGKHHLMEAEELFQAPPDTMRTALAAGGVWTGPGQLDLRICRPAAVEGIYVLGGAVDVPREEAERLLTPAALIELGSRLGAAAAQEAGAAAAPRGVRVAAGDPAGAEAAGEVREALLGTRAVSRPERWVDSPARALPVLGEYDVVVVGGGTGGAPAGIAAARQKAKTLVIELLPGLGGHGTYGAVSQYYWGYRRGFTAEAGPPNWRPMEKAEQWRRMLQESGGDAWFGVIGNGAVVDGNRVVGVVVATPHGRGVLKARAVVDSTGNTDIAAAAGAETVTTGSSEIAIQGAEIKTLSRGRGESRSFTTIVDLNDMLDVRQVFIAAKQRAPEALDVFHMIAARERRRIAGDFVMSFTDQMNERTYPDTIALAYSNFDTHGFTVDPFFLLAHPDKEGYLVRVPYRCLMPKGVDGILVTGLGISVHRDALPLVRMQADVQNQGYAAGVAAAMAAKAGTGIRAIDVRALQRHLVEKGNLPASVLAERDSYPLSEDRIREAVAGVKNSFEHLAAILAEPDRALPMLRKAFFASVSARDRLVYARILAVLGDAAGISVLVRELDAGGWDEGWNYERGANFIEDLSRVDALIVAVGLSRDRRGLRPILEKASQLTAASEYSHHRAVALALEWMGDPAAAGTLARLLSKPGMPGHARTTPAPGAGKPPFDPLDRAEMLASLRELSLGRALYRCGDQDGLGRRILESYRGDLRGHFARHADAVLRAGKGGGR